MYNVVENFLANPCRETFGKIRNNPYLLKRTFELDYELAKEFFVFKDWLILLSFVGITAEEQSTFKNHLKECISSFSDAIKYYHQLNYEERLAYQSEFIEQAKTVKDCQYLLYSLNKDHRKEIVEKMQQVAVTDEDKRIAFSYVI